MARPELYVTVTDLEWQSYQSAKWGSEVQQRLHTLFFYTGRPTARYTIRRAGSRDVAHPMLDGTLPHGYAVGEKYYADETPPSTVRGPRERERTASNAAARAL